LALGDEKVILLVDGANVNITGNITRNVGTGFFLLVTTGKITVSPAVGGGASPILRGYLYPMEILRYPLPHFLLIRDFG